MNKQSLGAKGEKLAAQHLEGQGYTIIAMNWRCRQGEIDIVAQQNDLYIFVEVKTRRSMTVQDALASITSSKREKFIKAVYYYLNEHQLDEALWRIDAIGVALPPNGKAIIEHVEDALDW
jgi:putative endonuclease